MDKADIMAKHCSSGIKIRYHSVFERPEGFNRTGGFPKHVFGFFPDCHNMLGFSLARNDRRFADKDAFSPHPHERIGGAQINAQIM